MLVIGGFGLPSLSIQPQTGDQVLSSYASLLAMPIHLKKSFQSLLRLQILGLEGPLGLFEAADFDPARIGKAKMRIVRSHNTAHQGMILCAICNALENGYIRSLFSSLPRAEAYRMLIEETAPRKRSPIRRAFKQPAMERPVPFRQMQREATLSIFLLTPICSAAPGQHGW